ncbi:MAG: nickel-type superoxide dismutase maturation protease [Alphaproteobacteria bacterium]|nr:nickel-type superoxide dismutase maturation protease [Alphaproteobacteria bacterium]
MAARASDAASGNPSSRLPTSGPRAWRQLVAWALRRRQRVRVSGHSMAPTLDDGDHVLVDLRPDRPPAVGALLWVRDPREPDRRLVKRLITVTADGRLDLRGDAPDDSTDSRHFGPVAPELVLGRVVYRFPR